MGQIVRQGQVNSISNPHSLDIENILSYQSKRFHRTVISWSITRVNSMSRLALHAHL